MLRYCVLPVRSIAFKAPVLSQLRLLSTTPALSMPAKAKAEPKAKAKTTKQTKTASKSKELSTAKKLAEKIKKEKAKHNTIQTKIKDHNNYLRQLSRERKLAEDASRGHRSLNIRSFIAKAFKLPPTSPEFASKYESLTEDELEKLKVAAKEYNDKCRSFFVGDKPTKPATKFALYLKENYVVGENQDRATVMGELAARWKSLPESEKLKYTINYDQEARRKEVEDWKQTRINQYKQYLDFKKNYEYKF
ncbi:predicted protein [Candida tropicalis MYA-3404]|uniref:HMG box domain-containing protein n=1 Tax=Candida tropicalis (strain ATCC MYA-3404 / T1) TaxID=294747 RepID=C5MAS6_CANTT|nr:predicted protein [Candida tropicalis MYA-3404]EER32743.1 predicted protein [Candida tropicalis MYA-3404]KAG4406569.1 hypothetical protein JTP64_003953 [Candida tropicalis]MCP8716750.1 hypothetical protein [Asgard group archaeon]